MRTILITLATTGVGMVALAGGMSALAQAPALVAPGPNKVAFPADWAKGTLYATVDRPDTKQYREFYSTPDVVEQVRAGKPIPDGAMLILAAYMNRPGFRGGCLV